MEGGSDDIEQRKRERKRGRGERGGDNRGADRLKTVNYGLLKYYDYSWKSMMKLRVNDSSEVPLCLISYFIYS